jgi:hypothetical protein
MGITTENNKKARVRKVLEAQNYTPLSAGTPIYWPTDASKIPDLLDFFVTSRISPSYTDIKPSYDLSSDHTPTIMTISTSIATHITTTRLHTPITDWNQYKTVIRGKLTTKMKIKTREDIEVATSELTDIMQQAVKTATPVKNSPRQVKYLPSRIKQMVAQKRRARARWQKTHTPDDRRHFNNANNKLRGALNELNNDTFTAYIASLRCEDQTIWRPIKSRKKWRTPHPPIRANTNPPSPWAKSDTEKTNLFASHLTEVYKPHDDTPDPEIIR